MRVYVLGAGLSLMTAIAGAVGCLVCAFDREIPAAYALLFGASAIVFTFVAYTAALVLYARPWRFW